jgi:hypothetical protein
MYIVQRLSMLVIARKVYLSKHRVKGHVFHEVVRAVAIGICHLEQNFPFELSAVCPIIDCAILALNLGADFETERLTKYQCAKLASKSLCEGERTPNS